MTQTHRYAASWRLLVLAAGVALLLAGCGGGKPDTAACERAMRQQFASATDSAGSGTTPTPGTKPKECNGLSDQQLEDLGKKVLGEQFSGTTAP